MGMMPIVRLRDPRTETVAPGDVLALVTDGIFEYENRSGVAFGEARVAELLGADPSASAAEILRSIVEAVESFAEGAPQNDDMTLVIVRRRP